MQVKSATSKKEKEPRDERTLPKLRQLTYSPDINPLLNPEAVKIRKKWVRAGTVNDLVDPDTGEAKAVTVIHEIKEVDNEQFVKLYADGVRAMFSLTVGATRVFQIVLSIYEQEPMHGGFSQCVALTWLNGGMLGKEIGMSEATFNRGMRELVANRFLSARMPGVYWINPTLICKGNRVMLVKEFRRKNQDAAESSQTKLEAAGQVRLDIDADSVPY